MSDELVGSLDEPCRLRSCGSRHNCAIDSPNDADPLLRPIGFRIAVRDVMRVIVEAVGDLPRTEVVFAGERYVLAHSRSRIFRFVDQVELLVDERAGLIHFRSQSSVGRRDFGVNRRRLRMLCGLVRQRLEA